jgi:hypothetical protein
MTVRELVAALRSHAELPLIIALPDGGVIPMHYHVTEIGHMKKRFIDCGGVLREQESCLLQTWVHTDMEHRLVAGKLAGIFAQAGDVLPHEGLPVEVEYEDGVVAQFPVEGSSVFEGSLLLQLGWKHTDCLARGICLPGECC